MGNILVVDDDAVQRHSLATLLRYCGHEAACARSGAAAIKSLRSDPLPDLVILDAMMPEMDGSEVLRQIRLEPRTAMMPVVMLSCRSEPDFIADTLAQGANAYWVKATFDYSHLGSRVAKQLAAAQA